MLRPTFAEIDLAALVHNSQQLVRRLPNHARLLSMVKADAYGHGAVPVARALVGAGTVALGVATIEEGLELRGANLSVPILVMGGMLGMGAAAGEAIVAALLTPVIHSSDSVTLLEEVGRRRQQKISVHLKIDTGMGRLGVLPTVLPSVLERLQAARWVKLAGVMTHLAKANDPDFTARQVELFQQAWRAIEAAIGEVPIGHIANSIAIMSGGPVAPLAGYQWWARGGIALYGGSGGITLPADCVLKPVMSLKSRIALVKWIPLGATVSYQCLFTAARKTRLAVVPIGYADGIPLSLTGKGQALVRGRRVPIIGRVTMDMIMLDVTDVAEATVGDEVVLLGRQGEGMIGVDELATLAGTIAYEITCRVSKRMPRIYLGGE